MQPRGNSSTREANGGLELPFAARPSDFLLPLLHRSGTSPTLGCAASQQRRAAKLYWKTHFGRRQENFPARAGGAAGVALDAASAASGPSRALRLRRSNKFSRLLAYFWGRGSCQLPSPLRKTIGNNELVSRKRSRNRCFLINDASLSKGRRHRRFCLDVRRKNCQRSELFPARSVSPRWFGAAAVDRSRANVVAQVSAWPAS